MKQACPGQCDFPVSRAGITPGVDSGDADAIYVPSPPGGLSSSKCSCWSLLPHFPFPTATRFFYVTPLDLISQVLFGAWLWVPGGPNPLLTSPAYLLGAEYEGARICDCRGYSFLNSLASLHPEGFHMQEVEMVGEVKFIWLPDFHQA